VVTFVCCVNWGTACITAGAVLCPVRVRQQLLRRAGLTPWHWAASPPNPEPSGFRQIPRRRLRAMEWQDTHEVWRGEDGSLHGNRDIGSEPRGHQP
jgi:hypothetical protein